MILKMYELCPNVTHHGRVDYRIVQENGLAAIGSQAATQTEDYLVLQCHVTSVTNELQSSK